MTRPLDVSYALGLEAVFYESASTPTLLAVGSPYEFGGFAGFQPGAEWSIGTPVLSQPGCDKDLMFYYSRRDSPGDRYLGWISESEMDHGWVVIACVSTPT